MVERITSYKVDINGRDYQVSLGEKQNLVNGEPVDIEIKPIDAEHGLYLLRNNKKASFIVYEKKGEFTNISSGHQFFQTKVSSAVRGYEVNEKINIEKITRAPMAGIVISTLAKTDEIVETNQTLIVIESMKMHLQIKSSDKGRVNLLVREGEQVDKGRPLFSIES